MRMGGGDTSSELWRGPVPFFNSISEDLLINIFSRLDADPRDLARLSCVCRRFSNAIHVTCWKIRCLRLLPSLVSDLTQSSKHAERLSEPPGGWASLQKLQVCCPGLWHAGVLLESWDFGLDRELGCSADYEIAEKRLRGSASYAEMLGSSRAESGEGGQAACAEELFEAAGKRKCIESEAEFPAGVVMTAGIQVSNDSMEANKGHEGDAQVCCVGLEEGIGNSEPQMEYGKHLCKQIAQSYSGISSKQQRAYCYDQPHLANGSRNLSREQGNKLLANRFRADSLYICDWPGCVHPGEKRKYKLFRGVFKNFKNTHVWRNLRDMKIKTTDVRCAFCSCKSTWDMVTSFCLKRSIEYHDDGEPVVRAYVCDNGHVAGAWTDRPLYNL